MNFLETVHTHTVRVNFEVLYDVQIKKFKKVK